MNAAGHGQDSCVQALLRAKANTELLDDDRLTALQWAEAQGHTPRSSSSSTQRRRSLPQPRLSPH